MWALRRRIILWWRSAQASARRKFRKRFSETMAGLHGSRSRFFVRALLTTNGIQFDFVLAGTGMSACATARCHGASAIGLEWQDGGGDWRDMRDLARPGQGGGVGGG